MLDIARRFLLRGYKGTSEDIKIRGDKITEVNKGKNLTERQKKSIKRKMLKLDRELMIMKWILAEFGLKIS